MKWRSTLGLISYPVSQNLVPGWMVIPQIKVNKQGPACNYNNGLYLMARSKSEAASTAKIEQFDILWPTFH